VCSDNQVSNHHGGESGCCQKVSNQPGNTIALGVSWWIKIFIIHNVTNLVEDWKNGIVAEVPASALPTVLVQSKMYIRYIFVVSTGTSFVTDGDLTSTSRRILLIVCPIVAIRLCVGFGKRSTKRGRENLHFPWQLLSERS
jgi:hypothetical protein